MGVPNVALGRVMQVQMNLGQRNLGKEMRELTKVEVEMGIGGHPDTPAMTEHETVNELRLAAPMTVVVMTAMMAVGGMIDVINATGLIMAATMSSVAMTGTKGATSAVG